MKINRRDLLKFSIYTGAVITSFGLQGCLPASNNQPQNGKQDNRNFTFKHGVASGDPLTDSVIIWTRVTPDAEGDEGDVKVSWEVATDNSFNNIINQDDTTIGSDRDYTVKVDVQQLIAGTTYYYRFKAGGVISVAGKTKTLPIGSVSQVKMVVFTCSNYPAGFFNVYKEVAKLDDLDVVLHVGDYIYEYARVNDKGEPEYASEDAARLNREVLPAHELVSLTDYRTRYQQYRSDTDLQAIHAKNTFIVVWDDHEIVNNLHSSGAKDHKIEYGSFEQRKQAAIQAYFEWMPLRPITPDKIYRQFEFGDLVNLIMLDTRVIGRDKQLDYVDYVTAEGLNKAQFMADVSSNTRSLLGSQQRAWLLDKINVSTATWQVLGQQVLMARMLLPAVTLMPTPTAPTVTLPEFGVIAFAAGKYQELLRRGVADTDVALKQAGMSDAELVIIRDVTKMTYLQSPHIPYNLDAWDGYAYDREVILETARLGNKRLISLAGDTHNAWSSNLTDIHGNIVGTEFACSSVTSPGIEQYLNIPDAPSARAMEAGVVQLVTDLNYCNLRERGTMIVTFTAEDVTCEWLFVNTIKSTDYLVDSSLSKSITVQTNPII